MNDGYNVDTSKDVILKEITGLHGSCFIEIYRRCPHVISLMNYALRKMRSEWRYPRGLTTKSRSTFKTLGAQSAIREYCI